MPKVSKMFTNCPFPADVIISCRSSFIFLETRSGEGGSRGRGGGINHSNDDYAGDDGDFAVAVFTVGGVGVVGVGDGGVDVGAVGVGLGRRGGHGRIDKSQQERGALKERENFKAIGNNNSRGLKFSFFCLTTTCYHTLTELHRKALASDHPLFPHIFACLFVNLFLSSPH